MKKKNLVVLGMLVLALAFGSSVVSCATISSVGGTVDTHGLFSSARAVSYDSDKLTSYGIILGLFDISYSNYVAKVREAEAAGKIITTVTTEFLGVYTNVTAYVADK
ncbi:MAG: hypothetical protein LBD74_03275 [Spirochaetaceae bacterium]|nr:hypothetical protein [Spirochaetaceae bacterium]